MNTSSEVLASLPKGVQVNVYFALQSSQGSWCKISVQSDRQSFGFVVCSQIHRGQAPPAAGTTPSAASVGNGPKSECADLVDQLIETTGIKDRSSMISKGFFAGITADAFRNAGSKEPENFLAIMQRDFGGPAVEAGVRQGLLNHCDPGNYAASLEVLHTPIAARMIKLETASTRQSAVSEFKNYSAKLRQDQAPPERVALLQRFDRATGGSEFINDIKRHSD
jgi:hypothetical protein